LCVAQVGLIPKWNGSRALAWHRVARSGAADSCFCGAETLKLIIFDCDGTLVDSQNMICAAMQRAYDAHDIACPPRERVLSIVGLSLREAFDNLGEGRDGFPVDGMIERYKEAFFELRHSPEHHEPLYPGARDAVLTLAAREDCLLGVATGKSQRGVRAILTHHDLLTCFATIKTADDAPSKPHPGMILEAMREAGAEPRDTIMIGDTTYDMAMARAAGVHAIGVNWGYHPHALLEQSGAHEVVSGFAELESRIETLLLTRASV
jgi:phosphoglycolate phosphatase